MISINSIQGFGTIQNLRRPRNASGAFSNKWKNYDRSRPIRRIIGYRRGGGLAEIDRMNLEVREYLSLHPSELKEQAA